MVKVPNIRILFVTSMEPNQGDIYFNGLKTLLRDKCIEFPYKTLYHLTFKNGKMIGYNLMGEAEVVEDDDGFLFNRKYLWKVPRYFGCVDFSSYKYVESVLPDVSEFDVIIFNFLRSKLQRLLLRKLLKSNEFKKPIFIIDGEDDPFIRNYCFNEKVRIYFKREILTTLFLNKYYVRRWEKFYIRNVLLNYLFKEKIDDTLFVFPAMRKLSRKTVPLNIAVNSNEKTDYQKEKKYDVSFIAAPTNPLRIKVYTFLKKYVKKRKLNAFLALIDRKRPIPYVKYKEVISNSKISISVQGAGFDTYRYWEIPCFGSSLLSQRPFIFIKNNFVDGESATFFNNFKELELKIDHLLSNERWEEICKNGVSHFLKNHTHVHRALEILNAIEEKLNK